MWVIFDGTGSLRIGGTLLRPGAQEVNDESVLATLREKAYPWITLSETRDLDEPEPEPQEDAEPESEAPEEVYERFRGRDGKWYYLRPAGAGQPSTQSEGFDTEEEAEAAIAADEEEAGRAAKVEDVDQGPESGPLMPSELTDSTFPCRATDCKKVFQSTGARRNHERIFHRKLAEGDSGTA